jgi:hypothetical protein
MNRLEVRDSIAEVVFNDDSCNDPECDNCQFTLDAVTDRVVLLMTAPV